MVRSATLQRLTIKNPRVARLNGCYLDNLAQLTTLDYLCVNQLYLTYTNNPDDQLLSLPSTLREFDLYHCQGDETLRALRYLINHVQQRFSNLRVLRVRLRQMPTNRHLDTPAIQAESQDLVRDYRTAGITLSIAIVTSTFTQ
jgi:hypothetical protein